MHKGDSHHSHLFTFLRFLFGILLAVARRRRRIFFNHFTFQTCFSLNAAGVFCWDGPPCVPYAFTEQYNMNEIFHGYIEIFDEKFIRKLITDSALHLKELIRREPNYFANFTDTCSSRLISDRNYIWGLKICHQLRHSLGMCSINMAVRIENQLAAVPVPLPFRDYFHVHAFFDCAGDEHPAQ